MVTQTYSQKGGLEPMSTHIFASFVTTWYKLNINRACASENSLLALNWSTGILLSITLCKNWQWLPNQNKKWKLFCKKTEAYIQDRREGRGRGGKGPGPGPQRGLYISCAIKFCYHYISLQCIFMAIYLL